MGQRWIGVEGSDLRSIRLQIASQTAPAARRKAVGSCIDEKRLVGLVNVQPTWYDRQGKVLGTISEPGEYGTVRLSPDDKRAVLERPVREPECGCWRPQPASRRDSRTVPKRSRLVARRARARVLRRVGQLASTGDRNRMRTRSSWPTGMPIIRRTGRPMARRFSSSRATAERSTACLFPGHAARSDCSRRHFQRTSSAYHRTVAGSPSTRWNPVAGKCTSRRFRRLLTSVRCRATAAASRCGATTARSCSI